MRRFALVLLLAAASHSSAVAQTTETPEAFDSAGRILSIGEQLAARLRLGPPAWPVSPPFTEARLYQVGDGSHVIVVQRANGVVDRYPLTADQVLALRAAVAAGTDAAGHVVAEDAASVESESARRPFVRNQMLLASFLYGPALASLTNDASTGTGAYLLSVGGTFFVLTDMAKHRTITKAQNNMATDGAIRGWLMTAAALNAAGVELNDHENAAAVLVGGIGGSVFGYQRARTLTNSEAEAAMTGSTLGAGTVLGFVGTTGVLGDDEKSGRWASAALVAGGVAGYVLGPVYPRRAGYSVTAGDISIVRLGAVLGTMAALTPIVDDDGISTQAASGLATIGWVGGAMLADRIAAKPFNHSASDSHMIHLGALGGALMLSAFPIMAHSTNATFNMAMATGGAIGGAVVAQRMMAPPRQGAPYVAPADGARNGGMHFAIDPQGLAMTLAKRRGNHSLLRITF